MASDSALTSDCNYQLKVHLRGISPMVWRRLLVSADKTLYALHRILQIVMGWESYHLHCFVIHGAEYGDSGGVAAGHDQRRTPLSVLDLRVGEIFLYEYDFGDSWVHEIRVEDILEQDPKKTYPVCIAGGHACPPEDSGGSWGYMEILYVLKRPRHSERIIGISCFLSFVSCVTAWPTISCSSSTALARCSPE